MLYFFQQWFFLFLFTLLLYDFSSKVLKFHNNVTISSSTHEIKPHIMSLLFYTKVFLQHLQQQTTCSSWQSIDSNTSIKYLWVHKLTCGTGVSADLPAPLPCNLITSLSPVAAPCLVSQALWNKSAINCSQNQSNGQSSWNWRSLTVHKTSQMASHPEIGDH